MTQLHRRLRRPRRIALALAALAVLLLPAVVSAHPLGNFTINHYTGIRVEPGRVLLDVVIDQAEIPTFQARLDFDTDGDGEVSDDEADAGRVSACDGLVPSLHLALDGAPLPLTLDEAGLTFPSGVGGLSTMRLVCGFSASPAGPFVAGARLTFADTSNPDRLGWREIVVQGSGVTVAGTAGALRAATTSGRLTAYPTNLLTQALADRSVSIAVSPGGPTLRPVRYPGRDSAARSRGCRVRECGAAGRHGRSGGCGARRGDRLAEPRGAGACRAGSAAATCRPSSGPPTSRRSSCSCPS